MPWLQTSFVLYFEIDLSNWTVYKGGQTATYRNQFSLSGFPNLRAEVTCRNTFMDRKVVDTGRRSGWFWYVL